MITTLANDAALPPGSVPPALLDAANGGVEPPQITDFGDRCTTPVQPDSEAALLARAKGGSVEAFSRLVGHCEKSVYRVAFTITHNREDAEDILQEAILKAYTHLGEFRGDSRFYTWLVRIAVNEALMKIRKKSSEQLESLDQPVETDSGGFIPRATRDQAAENPEQYYANAELQRILAEAIGKLAPPFRAVVLLRYVENFSTEQTAAMLGMRVSAVKSRLLRARLKLRQLLARRFKLSATSRKARSTSLSLRSQPDDPASGSLSSEAASRSLMQGLTAPHCLGVQEL